MASRPELVFAGRHVLAGSPITHVEYLPADEHGPGSWFVVSADDPGPGVIRDCDTVPIHRDCLSEDHPELGHGLDLASEYGAAKRVEGEWVADPG
jgi:hypothetical protein